MSSSSSSSSLLMFQIFREVPIPIVSVTLGPKRERLNGTTNYLLIFYVS
jgi:hypothetical protein